MTSRIDYNNPHGEGQLGLPYHYEMLSDAVRVGPFKQAIQRISNDKVVLESGTGSGVLSILAARAGASQVFSIELDENIAQFTQKNIANSGKDNIKLINKSTLDVNSDDINNQKADVVIAENLSTWLVTEPQILVMNHMTQNLANNDAICLPQKVFNYLELVNSKFVFEETIHLRTQFFEFTGIISPKAHSKPYLVDTFDMSKVNPESFSYTINVPVTEDGTINSIRLTSPLQVYDDITFDSSDSLMPPVVLPLPEDLNVTKGDTIELSISFTVNSDWDSFECNAKKL